MAVYEERTPLTQFRCARCGYGASCRAAPVRCPMCAGSAWNLIPPASLVPDLGAATPLARETGAEARRA